jgi:outer membrane protein insertion porin family
MTYWFCGRRDEQRSTLPAPLSPARRFDNSMLMKCWRLSMPLRATTLCAAVLSLLLSLFSITVAMGRDSGAGNTAVDRARSTPEIDFVGNRAFSSEKLLQILLMGTPRWFNDSGSINPNALHLATDILVAFYYDDGFLNVQVHEPQIASVNRAMISIYEGPLYRAGSIAIEGQLRFPRRDLESQLTMLSGQPFRGSTLQRDALALSDFYSDRGFAFVYVDPMTRMDPKRHLVDVWYFIKPGNEIRIDRITISGNTTTPEKVIRAALRIHKHELYSARAFHESMARLDALGLFSGTHITTEPSTKSDEINVRVTVVEKSKV